MQQLILHHYPRSPFAEKIRGILGFKRLTWTSVIIPEIMPKPDVIALTGGNRRTPFLQVGADIYCDTALIAEVLERAAPLPTLFPSSVSGLARILAQWADNTLFWNAIMYSYQPAGIQALFAGASPEQVQAFSADRGAFRTGAPRISVTEANVALPHYVRQLDNQLADGRPWLLGAHTSIVDFSAHHPLWHVRRAGALGEIIAANTRVFAWMQRVDGFGHGKFETISSAEAISIAAAQTPLKINAELHDLAGFSVGQRVSIAPSDYGTDPAEGELAAAYKNEFLLRRHDPRAGEVMVHFPRIGYHIKAIQQGANT